ncbi:hypothetical protein CH275_25710 [Rhodococcus sp. 06-235-1A]|uniref:DNA adenine methylase n=1 Tax=Rhodococcus sp. 06-235-1A TaxID=2022508 RepID=UPI000B9A72EB|nr:hypothetical protein CH275_25710 [Rhodococcus sp. 06-235-1A]
MTMTNSASTSHATAGPILRWAGSKRRLLPLLLATAPTVFDRYHEPFAGSACFLLALNPKKATLNDANFALISAYRSISRDTEGIYRRLTLIPNDENTYYKIRNIKPETLSEQDRATRFVYLNRNCFNGIYRTNRQGQFNVPYGNRTGPLPTLAEFHAFGRRLRRTTLKSVDFEKALHACRPGDFAYLDPPYFSANRQTYGEYGYETYRDSDVRRLIESVQTLTSNGVRVMISYKADAELLKALATSTWTIRSFDVHRGLAASANARTSTREILATNYSFRE